MFIGQGSEEPTPYFINGLKQINGLMDDRKCSIRWSIMSSTGFLLHFKCLICSSYKKVTVPTRFVGSEQVSRALFWILIWKNKLMNMTFVGWHACWVFRWSFEFQRGIEIFIDQVTLESKWKKDNIVLSENFQILTW